MNNKILILIIIFLYGPNLMAKEQSKFYYMGEKDFKNGYFDNAKFNFEKDITRFPKNINSYLYLAKIYKKIQNNYEYEKKLKTVLLLNPKHEEALYLYAKFNIENFNYKIASENLEILEKICKNLCKKKNKLKKKLKKNEKQKYK